MIFSGKYINPIYNSVISTPQLYDPTPNPSNEHIFYQYYLPKPASVKITIFDVQGKMVMEEIPSSDKSGLVTSQFNISELPAGIYFLTLKTDGIIKTQKFIKE